MAQYYTVAEANAKLPELTTLLTAMRSGGQQLAAMTGRQKELKQKVKGNGHHNPNEDIMVSTLSQRLEEQLRLGVEQLAKWGIELKDLSIGLIDFPAMREGRTVYLCWQLGEPEVAYWHETTTGFSGRQPLDDRIE